MRAIDPLACLPTLMPESHSIPDGEPSPATIATMGPKKHLARTALTVCLIALSLGYIGYVISQHVAQLQDAGMQMQLAGLLGLIVFATASIALTTLYHALLVPTLQSRFIRISRLGLAYAVGQIVRYLPGKVMGIVFEANFLRGQVTAATITFALLIQTVLSYAWATALAAAILATAWFAAPWPMWCLLPAMAALWLAHRFNWAARVLGTLPFVGRFMRATPAPSMAPLKATTLTLVLLSNWIPFFAGWACLLHGRYTLSESIVFGAAYLAASVVSAAMIVVPSGIVVREAIFIWIGSRFGLAVPELLLYGVVLRVALTMADLLNAGAYWLLDMADRRRIPA